MAGEVFPLSNVLAERDRSGRLYHEFLRVPPMSAGVYVLAPGATDPQKPHREDEVYVVLRGRATIRIEDADRAVSTGDTIFVPARVPHRFHSVTDELVVLVIFAPAETSPAAPA